MRWCRQRGSLLKLLLFQSVLFLSVLFLLLATMSDPMPEILSKDSLVAKYVTKPLWDKLSGIKTATSGFTLATTKLLLLDSLLQESVLFLSVLFLLLATMSDPMPEILSKDSLVAKYVTKPLWDKLSGIKTATSGFTLARAIACAVQFDDQHCGIYAGDWDSYRDFAEVFDPLIQEYHGISSDAVHTSDMNPDNIKGNIDSTAPVHSTRIRVGRNIDGFGLSPGITKQQRLDVESLMKTAFSNLQGDLAGTYFPLTGMDEVVRQQLVDDHFLFVSGDKNLQVSGMENEWPEGRGIFHNKEKTFLTWVNEEDQLRIISMQKGGDVKGVFERLARGIKAVGDSVKAESGKEFMLDPKYGFIHSCPTNLGTGMRASVHVDLPGFTKEGSASLKARCEELKVQPRGTRGESGGQTGVTYDISNKHRLGYTEVELVQCMIDSVNTLVKEDRDLQKKHGIA